MNSHWMGALAGFLLLCNGVYHVWTGSGGTYWGFPISLWTEGVFALIGFFFLILSVRALLRGEGRSTPKVYTDEDARQAKAELDASYLKEHGVPPEKPKQ